MVIHHYTVKYSMMSNFCLLPKKTGTDGKDGGQICGHAGDAEMKVAVWCLI